MRHIPNFITSLNLVSGFVAIVFLFRGDPVIASWLILAAMVFDFLDGFASRLLKAYSDMGKELDSLADAVSFGAAPGLVIYAFLGESLKASSYSSGSVPAIMNLLLFLVPAIFPVCAGLRLARFNIDTTQSDSFKGLPTPAAALAVISLVFASAYSDSAIIDSFLASPGLIIIFSLLTSALMVTRIPLLALKFHSWGFRGNEGKYILIITCILLVMLLRWSGAPLIIPAYIAVSLGIRS